jgi:hypothetical protein
MNNELMVEIRNLKKEVVSLRTLLTQPPRRWLNIHQAANYIGVSPKSIYNGRTPSAKHNPLPVKPVRRGGRLYWDR